MNYKIFLSLIIAFFILSCSNNKYKTVISGNIPNLPDGKLYLYKDKYNDRIDSVETHKGKFEMRYQRKTAEPQYLGIEHIDQQGIKRSFSFPTNAKYKGSGCNSQYFFSDSIIAINGELEEFTPKNLILSPQYKLVKNPKISAGMQTKALYNIDCDLFNNFSAPSILLIKNKIRQYPYSYHLLYNIDDNKNSFSPQQVDEFLKLFKGEITESESFKKLSAYNKKRFTEKEIAMPLLENSTGKKSEIMDSKYKKHLIVFWASWCGPCRQEIPLLKTIYKNKNPDLEFISISIDEDRKAWKKALNEEQMTWKQYIIAEKDPDYEKIQMRFRLNGAIPYTVLVDNDFKIIKATVGLSSEKNLKDFIKIEKVSDK
ncbi:TlpA disulfide reductase family protein [Chryseobacterium hagamense]|uniref:Thiol:disulfide interchange protein n=1 Tax=Chryseobacterium hagamense TaxID=395935 RepID=A0A511YS23_9FLAO|nr:TlpA disulfide reductase family protein [Chryseobacterium hagamense]GEN77992.1 thiol:disulfide interchange protein [Chryseobacterium hagamense]